MSDGIFMGVDGVVEIFKLTLIRGRAVENHDFSWLIAWLSVDDKFEERIEKA